MMTAVIPLLQRATHPAHAEASCSSIGTVILDQAVLKPVNHKFLALQIRMGSRNRDVLGRTKLARAESAELTHQLP